MARLPERRRNSSSGRREDLVQLQLRQRNFRQSPTCGDRRRLQQVVFGADGRLAERRLVEIPSGKVILRQILSAQGVKLLDNSGKELGRGSWTLLAAKAPELTIDPPIPCERAVLKLVSDMSSAKVVPAVSGRHTLAARSSWMSDPIAYTTPTARLNSTPLAASRYPK